MSRCSSAVSSPTKTSRPSSRRGLSKSLAQVRQRSALSTLSEPSSVPDGEALARGVLAHERRALSRLLTRVENRDPAGVAALRKLYPHTGHAATIGITGQPGAGK